jgi:L-threonylcarbamoyladenylate synthase
LRIHGPLAVTSANRTGEPPCQSVFEAINVFGDGVSVYLNGGRDSDTTHEPSTVVDASALVEGKRELRMIRQGAVSVEQFAEAGFSVVSP